MNPFKITIIAISVFVLTALTLFLDTGHFVMPIGLFKPTLILLVVLCLWFNKKRLIFTDFVLIGWALLLSLSSKFFLDIVLSQKIVSESADGVFAFLSLTHIVAFLLLFLWMILIAWKQDLKSRSIQIVGALGMFACFYANLYVLLIIPTIVWFIGTFIHKQKNETYEAISIFLFFAIAGSWITAYFYGSQAVLLQL
jgi:hypothetical protein